MIGQSETITCRFIGDFKVGDNLAQGGCAMQA